MCWHTYQLQLGLDPIKACRVHNSWAAVVCLHLHLHGSRGMFFRRMGILAVGFAMPGSLCPTMPVPSVSTTSMKPLLLLMVPTGYLHPDCGIILRRNQTGLRMYQVVSGYCTGSEDSAYSSQLRIHSMAVKRKGLQAALEMQVWSLQ